MIVRTWKSIFTSKFDLRFRSSTPSDFAFPSVGAASACRTDPFVWSRPVVATPPTWKIRQDVTTKNSHVMETGKHTFEPRTIQTGQSLEGI